MSYIFISSPYTHPDPDVRQARYVAVAEYAATLMRSRIAVYSPIVHSHHLVGFGLPDDHEFWMRQCLPMVRTASWLHVLQIDGWRESRGVTAEIAFAENLRIPVRYFVPSDTFSAREV